MTSINGVKVSSMFSSQCSEVTDKTTTITERQNYFGELSNRANRTDNRIRRLLMFKIPRGYGVGVYG